MAQHLRRFRRPGRHVNRRAQNTEQARRRQALRPVDRQPAADVLQRLSGPAQADGKVQVAGQQDQRQRHAADGPQDFQKLYGADGIDVPVLYCPAPGVFRHRLTGHSGTGHHIGLLLWYGLRGLYVFRFNFQTLLRQTGNCRDALPSHRHGKQLHRYQQPEQYQPPQRVAEPRADFSSQSGPQGQYHQDEKARRQYPFKHHAAPSFSALSR